MRILSPLFLSRPGRKGMALVLVLSCLTLLSILVIAFLSSITTEVESSSSYANSNDVKQRSQTAINMVIAQIQDATSSSTIAWSSQPGLIRTFTNGGISSKSYKLYSSANMVADGSFNPGLANTEVPDNWKTRPSEYTDLNQPMLVSDPNGTFIKDSIKYTPNYPILDPGALGTVKGFSIYNATTPPNYSGIDPLANNPAPMPVQWLYMLKDGSLRAVDSTTGKIPDAKASNPVVSRIAFWTDDETCKVNINTAAGDDWNNTTDPGSFADMPMANQAFEGLLRSKQPVSHEYQRYPGHPATTYLSAVFPNLTRDQIYDIVPRVSKGGSAGGTIATFSGSTSSVAALPLSDGMPLYASVDELRYVRSLTARGNQDALFSPKQIEEAKFFLTAHSRAPEVNLFNQPRITMWPEPADPTKRTAFDRTIAFCSTVGGKAFYFVRNFSDSPTKDYTSYIRNQELYTYLQTLTNQNIPGFGGSFLAKYPAPLTGTGPVERDQILTELYDYIRGSINLIDTNNSAPYAGTKTTTNSRTNAAGTGQVVPIQIGTGPTATRGFGHMQTIYSVNLRFESLDTGVYNRTTGTREVSKTAAQNSVRDYKLITTKIQSLLLINSFIPSQGVVRNIPNLIYEVTGLDGLSVEGIPLGFPSSGAVEFNKMTPNQDYAMGGFSGAGCLFFQTNSTQKALGTSTLTGSGVSDSTKYPFFSSVINLPAMTTVPVNGAEFKQPLNLRQTGTIKLKIYVKDKSGQVDTANPIQTFELKFPDTTFPAPAPNTGTAKADLSLTSATPGGPSISPDGCMINGSVMFSVGGIMPQVSRGLVPMAANVRGDLRLVAGQANVDVNTFVAAGGYYGKSRTATVSATNAWAYNYVWPGWSPLTVPPDPSTDGMMAGSDRNNAGGGWGGYPGSLVSGVTYNIHTGTYGQPQGGTAAFYPDPDQTRPNPMKMPDGTTPMPNEALLTGRDGSYRPGDWDNGSGGFIDGSYINKADEGETGPAAYSSYDANMSIGSLFSPNRQVPSAAMFGSLSTGVSRRLPWQTLLFCPNPPAKDLHPGWGTPQSGSAGPGEYPPYTIPPDHLFMDLFTMPVVEPYAISEPFSTAGKINLNYQIAPFTYITRNTGLQAVLRSTRVSAIPTADGTLYHNSNTSNPTPYRMPIDINATMKGFQDRFDANQPFRSASEICEMFLVPTGVTISGSVNSTMKTWWDTYKLTGDNLRERPYTQIYSRLTTKSNTYTVHVRVQTLKKSITNKPDEWVEGTDKVMGEYRGSYGIERYLDPNLSTYTMGTPLTAYKFRTLTTKQFTP